MEISWCDGWAAYVAAIHLADNGILAFGIEGNDSLPGDMREWLRSLRHRRGDSGK